MDIHPRFRAFRARRSQPAIAEVPAVRCPRRPSSRGQALVEFALILPVLMLTVLGALDLGRAFLTTIAMENAAKEGAFYGARSPACDDAGAAPCGDPNNVTARVQAELDGVTLASSAIRCYAAGTTIFTGPGRPLDDCEDGDLYYVELHATFELITPLISNLVGDSLTLGTSATSVVLTSFDDINASPIPIPTTTASASPAPGMCTVPDFTLGPTKIRNAEDVWTDVAGFVAANLTTSGHSNDSIVWQSVAAGTSSPCSSTSITVSSTVMATPTPTPTATASATATATASATATPPGQCSVPTMVHSSVTQAQGLWSAAGFSAANFSADRPPQNDYQVDTQSLLAGTQQPCLTATVMVAK